MSNKLRCDCCGKTFWSKYYVGGYIDHVTNFSRHRNKYAKEKNLVKLARNICFNGNEIYPVNEINTRLNCFMHWEGFSYEEQGKIREIVTGTLSKIKDASKEVIIIRETASPMALALLKGDNLDDCYYDVFVDSVHKAGMNRWED